MPKAATNNHYQAADIKVLEGLEPVRKRPGMYIGSTDSRGLHHLAKEILDNAVDEAIAGFGKTIQLFRSRATAHQASLVEKLFKESLEGQETITVVDNGRGIPVDMHESGVSALEVVLTKLHAGGKFEETAYQASGGLHGVGSSAVNALSSLLQVVVKRDGKYHYQYYSQGKPQAPVKVITEAEVQKLFPEQSVRFVTYDAGTLLSFIPDQSLFSTVQYSHKTLIGILKDRAYLMAGIYFQLLDKVEDIEKHYYFEGGIRSLVEHINMSRKPIHGVMHADQVWTDDSTGKKIVVEIALQFNDSYKEILESYVNVIHTADGGTHVNGFRMALGRVVRDYAEKNGLIKEKESFTTEDLKEGLTAVVFVKMPSNDLQFESQTKTKLNNSEAQSAVYQVFKDSFTTFLEENPKAGRAIVDKVMLSARARMAARAAKDAIIRKGVLEGSSLPGKLADCQSRIAAESEIYIVEGDSAGGCFSGDTLVALADGRNLSFKDLVKEQQDGKDHYCYTIRKNGKIGLEKILHPRITKKGAQVIELTLDNGETITCTPDHRFMLRDGSYKQAKDLSTNDSLMPLYRQYSDMNHPGITIDGYEIASNYNHKILSVKKLEKRIDVYDIEVPNTHNFALASGVFVHNSAKQGRDRKFQAIFPLRGKILNTERARLDKIVAFEELKNLVIALGAGIGETFNEDKLRYHRIILMNDADVDGEHITTLGLTFFFRHLPQIVERGYLYVAMPPLFKISHGKNDEYAYSDEERDQVVARIKQASPNANIGIQRYKGLGEMNPEQLWDTTMNPKTRMLKRIAIDDMDKADETFSILMGDDVAPRKKFIQTHAKLAELDV
jgi:DNA gyrase subunit B